MISSADFKATVQEFIERSGSSRLPGPGEVVLVGSRLIPALPISPQFFAYVVLTAAAAVMVWSQIRLAYAIALALSVVQFARSLVLYAPLIGSDGLGTVAVWLAWLWTEPALIWVLLGLYQTERLRRRPL